jgi:hypothetical protein
MIYKPSLGLDGVFYSSSLLSQLKISQVAHNKTAFKNVFIILVFK